MSIPRFGAYAAAFEKAFENDDWSVVEPFFHEDAVYEVALPPPFGEEGPDPTPDDLLCEEAAVP